MALGKLPEEEVAGEAGIFAEINITPLTDIFLVLLVIFMVTSTAAIESAVAQGRGIRVNLPQTAGAEQAGQREDPVLTLTQDGSLYLDGARVDSEKLGDAVRAALAKSGGDTLIVRADKQALFGRAVELMGEARKAGAVRISVQVVPKGGP